MGSQKTPGRDDDETYEYGVLGHDDVDGRPVWSGPWFFLGEPILKKGISFFSIVPLGSSETAVPRVVGNDDDGIEVYRHRNRQILRISTGVTTGVTISTYFSCGVV